MIDVHALHEAFYGRLEASLAEPVYSAGQVPTDAPKAYVVIQLPATDPRNTKTTKGSESMVSVRCHTRFSKGRASYGVTYDLMERADDALQGAPLQLEGGHVLLHLPDPSKPVNTYDTDAHTVIDGILQYRNLKTQDLS